MTVEFFKKKFAKLCDKDPSRTRPANEIESKFNPADGGLPEFMFFTTPFAKALYKPIGLMYLSLHKAISYNNNSRSWILRDYFLFFLIALFGAIFLSPRYLVIAHYLIKKYILNITVPLLDTSDVPYIPNLLIPMFLLFTITYFFCQKTRLYIVITLALPFAIIFDGSFDIASTFIYMVFLIGILISIKLQAQRTVKLVIICSLAVLLLYFCTCWPFFASLSIGGIAAFQATLIPMLWYSVYEELPPKRMLKAKEFFIYHYTRIFGAPVLTYKDLFAPADSLLKVRFEGIKAIYVAVIASALRWAIANLTNSIDESGLRGLGLLLFSYGEYVERYCRTWVVFNLFIGVARIFGIPVRDNFNYWLLARTPNEHWRRWNILMREWVITFIFFPIMRGKKWLFVAIMASLMVSGVLHIIPLFMSEKILWFKVCSSLSYWFLNGLSIYAVIKLPIIFPRVIDKLRIRTSQAWSVVGIILTSAFYGILYQGTGYRNLEEVGNYFSRLFGL